MTGKLRDIIPVAGGEWIVSFTTRTNPGALFDTLKDKEVSVEIKKAAKGRSNSQNAFMWSLCSGIGRAFTPPEDKEEIYRRAIRAVGVYTEVILYMWDIKTVLRRWSEHGTGWFAEVVDDAGTGKKVVHLYYGTSTYSVDEMRVVIDWLVDEAEQCGVPVPAGKEREELYHEWGFC